MLEKTKLTGVRLMVMYCGKRFSDSTILEQTGIVPGDVLQVMVFKAP